MKMNYSLEIIRNNYEHNSCFFVALECVEDFNYRLLFEFLMSQLGIYVAQKAFVNFYDA